MAVRSACIVAVAAALVACAGLASAGKVPSWLDAPRSREDIANFEQWFKQQPGAFMHPNVSFLVTEDVTGGADVSVGVQATGILSPGDDAFIVPENLILRVREPWYSTARRLKMDSVEALSYIIAVHAEDEKSTLQPYLRALPHKPFVPLFWNRTAIELLAHNNTYGYARQVVDGIFSDYKAFNKKVQGMMSSAAKPRPETLKWAMAIALSRGTVIESKNATDHPLASTPLLVPALDMLNHGAQLLRFGIPTKEAVKVGITRPIAPGHELTFMYRPMPNAFYLAHYGIVPRQNPYDQLPINLDTPHTVGSDLYRFQQVLLHQLKLSTDMWVTVAGLTNNIQNVLRVLAINRPKPFDEIESWSSLDMTTQLLPVDQETADRALILLQHALAGFLNLYLSHPLYTAMTEEEQAEVAAMSQPTQLWTAERILAVRARLAEQRLLSQLWDDAAELLQHLYPKDGTEAAQPGSDGADEAEAEAEASARDTENQDL